MSNGQSGTPSPWVGRFIGGIVPAGRILDVACGRGRHLRLALAKGYLVTGIDRDLRGVADLASREDCELIEADLEAGGPLPLAGRLFDGVIVTNYLWRPMLTDIVAAVGPAGVLIYETFARGQERLGRPTNPDFLLAPNELIAAAFPRLVVIAYEQVTLGPPNPRVVQRITAVGPRHPWTDAPPAP